MKREFTLKELVKKYGSDAQKESLKKKGNLSGKEFSILIKSVEQEWESYTVEGRGSKRIIICTGKRSRKAERVDKRSNNGKGQLIGEFELSSLVVNYLIQNNNKVSPMSTTRWINELTIVDNKLIGALYGERSIHLQKLQGQFRKGVKNYNQSDSDIDMLDEFLQTFFRHLKSSLVSVFNKLSKAKVISYKKEQWCCTNKGRYRKLKKQEIKTIADIRNKLLFFHELEVKDLFKKNMKEVKAFKKGFDKQLEEQLGLKFYYDAHLCVLQNGDLDMREYLDRLQEKDVLNFTHNLTERHALIMIEVFKDMHGERSLELAKVRQENNTNKSDSSRIKCLKILKQYAPMWEQLLKYFKCKSSMKSNPAAFEKVVIQANVNELSISHGISEVEGATSIEKWEEDAYINEKEASFRITLSRKDGDGECIRNAVVTKSIAETFEYCNIEKNCEYLAAMEDIRGEIREYEDKYGDKAMDHMTLAAVIRDLTRNVTAEEVIAEFEHELQCKKEREKKEWDKLFEGGWSAKQEVTTNNPLETFQGIRYGRI
ncbi:hypothetical protein LIV42_12650 [Bacillus cereus]|uniref:hypothetical protein n=1 Tax=Bacillus cereus TaxID=1396 RepID=UPI001D074A03|nr:hypothetical protein [Bacillus cereus]MCB5903112.1 hypothetical protein [Bacillus cereus]